MEKKQSKQLQCQFSVGHFNLNFLRWLYKETAVCEVEADLDDGQFLRFKVLLSDVQLAKFKSYFLKGRQTG